MSWWRRKARNQDLDRELRAHLDCEAEETGLPPVEARYAARRAFGNVTLVKEITREMWGFATIDKLGHDVRYALRTMRRSPGLTAVAVLSLALGIGANSAIFSLMDAVLLRLLPVENPEQLERVGVVDGGAPAFHMTYPLFRELRQRNQVFSGVFARSLVPASLVADGRTERGSVEIVSGSYFSVLGVRAMLGRTFTDDDDRLPLGHPVTVLSYNYWRRLGADSGIIGKTIRVDSHPFTVIGVAAAGFFGIEVGAATDAWVPMMMQPQVFGRGQVAFDNANWGWMSAFGRRSPEMSHAQAQAGLNITFQQLTPSQGRGGFFNRPAQTSIHLAPVGKGLSRLRGQYENPLYVLMVVVALVLLIACANIANLLLARSAARRKEIAMRLALGASRGRLIRQLLTESTLLGVFGGSLGLLFSAWGVSLLLRFLPSERLPIALDVGLDLRLLGFTLAVSVATGLVFGLLPALQATKPDLAPVLKDECVALGGSRLRKVLVASQVAVSLLLLIGAGLFLQTLRNAASIHMGLQTDNVLMASFSPELNGYTPGQVFSFYQQLELRLRAVAEIAATGTSQSPLLSGEYSQVGMTVPDRSAPTAGRSILVNTIGGDFFRVAGIAIVRGRGFGPQDTAASPRVALISETAARHFFGNDEAVGRLVKLGGRATEVEIIGIVADSKYRSVREDTPRIAYFSFDQDARPGGERTIYVRTAGDPAVFAALLRREVQAIDRDLPIYGIKTFAAQKIESLARERLIATLSGFFGVLALLLASIGLYGVMAYTVLRRTREIGIRMSLGARRTTVIWMVLRDSLAMVGAGIAIGIPLSVWLSRLVVSQLFGVTPGDPLTIALATLVLLSVATFAGFLPALRAARVDPTVALRYE